MTKMEPLFALDIGTRMVMGLIISKTEGYEILASAQTEHRQRAMYDGQVHDVDEVSEAVIRVKKELERMTGMSLKSVAVAAAGRSLITELATAERSEQLPVKWEREDVTALELEAVQKALRNISPSPEDSLFTYHCVGYHVVKNSLEGEEISSLIGQRGKSVSITVIATFLPRTVIDGLVAVLIRTGLEMHSLTLEPIAAGMAAIPENMRRMNLALVDIGAGTADIALTRNGKFFAYGMVPMAGDEVTEAICAKYLLDFHVGEKIKRELIKKKTLSFTDFFGKKIKLSREEIQNCIDPVVDQLADKIAAEILGLNGEIPQAVILIGGGSLTPRLPEVIADIFGITRSRVGIQIRERLGGIQGAKEEVKGPESITPIGIGMAALEHKVLHYYSVYVNDVSVPVFELQMATAAEVLLAAGIQPRLFVGRPGAAITFEFNDEMRMIKGSLGKPAQIHINGQPGRLEQTISAGDSLRFTPGIPGEDAAAVIRDVIPEWKKKEIIYNGNREYYEAKILLNGKPADGNDKIPDHAKIQFIANDDLNHFLKLHGEELNQQKKIRYQANGQKRQISIEREIFLNGEKITNNCSLNGGEIIECRDQLIPVGSLGLTAEPMTFYVNDQEVSYPPDGIHILHRGKEIDPDTTLTEGMDLKVEGFKMKPILSQILPYVDLPDQASSKMKLQLTVNNNPGEFTTLLHPGDRIGIVWV